ncbi:MAG: aldehyde:ferredoxin oxidoreductase, partial [Candidatus Lokiarchaeota archaeon]|nr:aldehyde:ferredoxin oxidoreductase [Candidatus Lokiarchaeota archaeon]MBD3200574.1 aldehyde:ferredoxin oxidoreductase [Candidatus Lokiarchaeota archaeon]
MKVKKKYDIPPIEKGYANQTLYIDLTTKKISIKSVSEEMKKKFVGGKGFDLWLMWNSLPKDKIVKWNDPENEICISSGPLGGSTFYPGSGKSIVTTISPLTGIIIDSNVGGYFGPYLKFSGFDAIEIQGKADKEVIIYIDGIEGYIEIEELNNSDKLSNYSHELTQELTEKYAQDDTEKNSISVVSSGPAAKHSYWGMLNFSWFSRLRDWASSKQAGRGGSGTVFANKNIKALVCRSPKVTTSSNNPADLNEAKELGKTHSKEIVQLDPIQNEMRRVGTGHLPDIMNVTDLLPTENFRYGAHKKIKGKDIPFARNVWKDIYSGREGADGCWIGCTVSCSHYSEGHYVLTGPFKGEKVLVDGPEYETIAGCGSNWGVWDPKWVLEANFYCDTYGLDTISVGTGIAFVMECFENGILDKQKTGGLDLNFGNAKEALELIHQMAKGNGFGVIVGKGIRYMKKYFAEEFDADPNFLHDIGMEHKGLEFSEYVTKESLAQQGGYGLTNKGPQHDEAWLIFEDMVRNTIPTFEDKAKALHWFPMWRTWFSLCGLCKLPWNDIVPSDNAEYPIKDPKTGSLLRSKIPKHVEWYAKYFSAITGREAKPEDLITMSERVYNFQRIFNIRQGKGLRKNDSNLPYRAMGPVTSLEYESRKERYDEQLKELGLDINNKTTEEKILILREHRKEQYVKLQDAVYEQRGWNKNGCPTIEKVEALGIDFDDLIKV